MASVISFRIDDEDKELLQQIADKHDATISWAARRAIKQYLTNLTKEYENENNNGLHPQNDEAVGGEGTYSNRNDSQSEGHQV